MEESHKISFFVSHLPSDHERVALGNEEGLFVIHVTKDGKNHLKSRLFGFFFFKRFYRCSTCVFSRTLPQK